MCSEKAKNFEDIEVNPHRAEYSAITERKLDFGS